MAAAWCQRHLEDEFIVAEIRSAGPHAWDGAEAAGASEDSSPMIHGLWAYLDDSASEVWDPQGTDLDSYRRSAREIGAAMRRLIGQILRQQRGRT